MNNNVFAEKYRPNKLDDVKGQEHIVPYLKEFVKNKDIPHMLFAGKAGTGKTTCAIALAKDIYGKDWKHYFMEMNASDERKLTDIRTKVKEYARSKIIGEDFKIIFMDEADNIHHDGQPALRRIIEKYSSKCRFILSCNYPNKIIDPIKDRCVVFRFKGISAKEMQLMLNKIAEKENIDITKSANHTLAVLSNGSMRRALNTLQKLKLGNVTNITEDTIYNCLGYIDDDNVRTLLIGIRKGNIKVVDDYVDNLLNTKVYSPEEIIESLERLIKDSNILSKEDKIKALTNIADIDFRLSMGATPEIQLKAYAMYLINLYRKYEVKNDSSN